MSGESGDTHQQPICIEQWEIEVAKSVAGSFKSFPEHEDIQAELYKHLVEIKSKKHLGIRNWKSFLAKSLYNAAYDFIRKWHVRHKNVQPLEMPEENEEGSHISLEKILAAPDERINLKLEVSEIWKQLSPELQKLWSLMVEEEGNKASVARRLGRPRKTVEYWIMKLQTILEKHGFG